ncbi:TetR/AcrR family transcriptional regulator C-terminal domain-containing protein [Streptomyces sp. NPDC055099]
MADTLAAVEHLGDRARDEDLRATVTDLAHRPARLCCSDRARVLRRLTYAQVAQFPGLVETVHERTAHRPHAALADRLARLSGWTRRVPAAELRGTAEAAVDTFLRAYVSD